VFWSPQQDQALAAIHEWLRTGKQQVFRLFGFAGTGKTTVATEINRAVPTSKCVAFTGKASYVMRQRGCEPCSTIHHLIYNAHYNEYRKRFFYTLKTKEELAFTKLIIVDECSMVNDNLAYDLLSFGIPVLVVGDPVQLPPVNGSGFFMEMEGEPDIMLTEAHRQALENPILRLANEIRAGASLPRVGYRAGDLRISQDAERTEFDTILVGRNATRALENRRLRVLNGFCRSNAHKTEPQEGETVVCLHNDYSAHVPLFNGTVWSISELSHDVMVNVADIDDDDGLPIVRMKLHDRYNGNSTVAVPLECFGAKEPKYYHGLGLQQFDYGYALTVHKAQGSEWADVLLINEAPVFAWHDRDQAQRWLYTAVTRAFRKLTILDYN
jgi:exodeoxyribonuclease-5